MELNVTVGELWRASVEKVYSFARIEELGIEAIEPDRELALESIATQLYVWTQRWMSMGQPHEEDMWLFEMLTWSSFQDVVEFLRARTTRVEPFSGNEWTRPNNL